MQKLTPEYDAQRDVICTKLREAKSELVDASEEFNKELDAAWDKFQSKLDDMNETIMEARTLRDEIVSDIQDFIDEHAEKWQNGKRGQGIEAWKNDFDGVDLNEIEVSKPDAIDLPEIDEEAFGNVTDDPAGTYF